jgi:hypothetical protein
LINPTIEKENEKKKEHATKHIIHNIVIGLPYTHTHKK